MYQDKTLKEVYSDLETSEKGLSSDEANERINKYGLNELTEKKKISPWKIFFSQFGSPIVWILILAVIISIVAGEYVDALIIFIILKVNAILGFVQEYKAEKAIDALKKIASLKAVVIRNGIETTIDAKNIVPGDIIVLSEGEKIPADARLIESNELKNNESSLTGESIAVEKKTGLCKDTILGNMFNMVFSGTSISSGNGKAVVIGTGMSTELGKIAHLIQETERPLTPLQKQLKKLGLVIGVAVIMIAVVVYFLGVSKGGSSVEVLLSALALAVAAVPEGLPAVITISLALGVQKMLKRNALIRKLPSVEALGSCTVICSDKTGTLTKGEMTVKRVFVDDKEISVSGTGYNPEGVFSEKATNLKRILECGALCNNAKLQENGEWSVIGDGTEGALLVSAKKAGIDSETLNATYKKISEVPFNSERKMMSVVYQKGKQKFVYTKGAPEHILDVCTYILVNNRKRKLTEEDKKNILKTYATFGISALRVLGFAYKEHKSGKEESGLTFLGLQGMIDPARPEVKDAITKAKTAGIRTVMITGDYEITAKAIAQELGIEGKVITGKELENIDLEKEIENISVFARVNPRHKLRIVEVLQRKGHVVAMTGDGVNDAPALKKADIGIAMGITGTDVAKESSELILMDDNYSSIVNAVEEGRNVFANIRSFVEYLFSSNIGEVLVIFLALLLNMPLPLIAIQILWINLLTDGFPALALGVNPGDKNIMQKPPRIKKAIIPASRWVYIGLIGLVMTFGTLAVFDIYNQFSLAYAQTMAFTTLVMFQLFNVFNLRSSTRSVFGQNPFNNLWLLSAVALSVGLQLIVLYSPLSEFFRTVPLQMIDWIYVLTISSSVLVVGELVKFFKFVFSNKKEFKVEPEKEVQREAIAW